MAESEHGPKSVGPRAVAGRRLGRLPRPGTSGRAKLDSACVGGGAASESMALGCRRPRAWNPCVILFSALMLSPETGPSKFSISFSLLSLSASLGHGRSVNTYSYLPVEKTLSVWTTTEKADGRRASSAPAGPVRSCACTSTPGLSTVCLHVYICKGRDLG